MLASAQRPVKVAEVGYTFRQRNHGESKLDVVTGLEYLFLVLNKLLGDVIPVQLTMFLLVGGLGLITHLASLIYLVDGRHMHFVTAQIIATSLAMTENFFLNNLITFRDRRLHGRRVVPGMLRFVLACSFGAWANVVFARALNQNGVEWLVAGLAGIVMGSVWNLSVSSFVTWPARRPPSRGYVSHDGLVNATEAVRG
jgi:dolichol-phosphate mannosyltransferase